MKAGFLHRGALALIGTAALVGGVLSSQAAAHAAGISFTQDVVGPFGGEPSITSDSNGVLYDSSPTGPQLFRGITNTGTGATAWTAIQPADNNSGDDCLNTDSENSLYWCNLGSTSVGTAPLQADVWKSATPTPTTCTSNCSWQYGNNATTGSQCSTSCNPFGVDRQWVASYIAAGQHTGQAEVVLAYHDFYGPSHIWVNISTNGGQSFGAAQEVLSQSTASPKLIVAEGYTFCNTVPIGVGIAPPGSAHQGRIFVAWIASDPVADASGCNITQNEAFHTAWISYSDTGAAGTWNPQLAFDAGAGRDMSLPFAQFVLDDQGNPYIAFNSQPPAAPSVTSNVTQLIAPGTCKTETDNENLNGYSSTNALQTDPNCSYQTYVVWSQDGGNIWNGGGGGFGNPTTSGAAATPYLVGGGNPVLGTDQFATIAAGDPGQVAVSYLHTGEVEPQGDAAVGKFDPLGCAGPETVAGVIPPPTTNYPPRCQWNLFAAQSNLLGTTPTSATWLTDQVTNIPMHYGDICNLGIACAPTTAYGANPRNLLDFNMETIDPRTGCAHIGFANDNLGPTYGIPGNNDTTFGNQLVSADQTSGCFGALTGPSLGVPEAPMALIVLPVGLATIAGVSYVARRRRSRTTII